MPFHATCGKGIASHADTVESFRNEAVIGAKHGAGFCRNPVPDKPWGTRCRESSLLGLGGGSDGARTTGG